MPQEVEVIARLSAQAGEICFPWGSLIFASGQGRFKRRIATRWCDKMLTPDISFSADNIDNSQQKGIQNRDPSIILPKKWCNLGLNPFKPKRVLTLHVFRVKALNKKKGEFHGRYVLFSSMRYWVFEGLPKPFAERNSLLVGGFNPSQKY